MTKFNFDDIFEREKDGKLSCKIDPLILKDEKYEFTLHKIIRDISNQHGKILDDWCKAYLAKEYEIGNDIHPGCFNIEQREVSAPSQCGWEYMIVPNDQNLGMRVQWIECSKSLPEEDIVVLCYCPEGGNYIRGASWMDSDYCLGSHKGGSWKRVDNENISVYSWLRFPKTEVKFPEWKKLEWCCENLYNSTNKEYSMDSGYPENPPVLMGDDNSLFIGKIQERIKVCPWCGKEVNNG